MFCTKCGAQVSANGRFCSTCGDALNSDTGATMLGDSPEIEGATIAPPAPPDRKAPATRSFPQSSRISIAATLTSSDPIGGGRFTPGQIIAERYRVVALAGRGGMGEVYRAEDLKLAQVVAIKFLPEALSQDSAALSRFHAEVRTSRQVSHPNVCRVFDIGEADGVLFLTMEYVDGEDLASVVRRIGRLSSDKATEIARQICAGLAAAHERGVIHRDLKPANIMLDGAGKIRITDFGLAGIAASIKGAEIRAGTPAYMAPEQLAGHEVSTKSDIYSLGLILYEILTGKRVFEATTLPELMKQRESGAITNPSTLIRDLDPLIERVILRCLENDPEKRPATSLQVAAALPGGDPLAAALAAGETPSPQMVAAAGENTGLQPRTAILCLAAAVVGVVLYIGVALRENGLDRVHLENSPEVLSKKSREIISSLGYADPPVDRADGFWYDQDYLNYLEKSQSPKTQWDHALSEQPPVIRYWYRQSPRELNAVDVWSLSFTPRVVTFSDPPPIVSGMINLQLDPAGRLITFEAIPPEKEEAPATPLAAARAAIDWKPLFAAAGLDLTQFHPAEPAWESLAAPDTRGAWDGVWPGTGRPLHVEAAARRGKPVYFSLTGPWSKPKRMTSEARTRGEKTGQIIGLTIALAMTGAALFLAYRNYSRGKVDRQGAFRLAVVLFATEIFICLFRSHFVPTINTVGLAILGVSTAMFVAAFLWMLYLALEPYVRRNWPQTIISWTRMLSGNLRDPLVGRDVLFGILLGITWDFVIVLSSYFHVRAGDEPILGNTELLLGFREIVANGFVNVIAAIQSTLVFFLILFLLRALVKNRWLAALLFVVLFTVPRVLGSDRPFIDAPAYAAIYGIAAFSLVRFGLITLAVGVFTADVIVNVPISSDFSNWYAARSLALILSFIAIAGWAFYNSLAGRRLWKDELFE